MPMIPSILRKLSWQAALVSLVAGGIIHIAATLVMPLFATANGIQRLANQLPANRMRVLQRATPEAQPVPFIGPDTRLAVCRYDVSDGPVRISAVLPDKGWTITLYTLQGENYYAMPAQDFRRLEVGFVLLRQSEKNLWFFSVGRSVETAANQITVPHSQGLAVVRAPVNGRAYQPETEAALARAACTPQRA